MAQSENPTGLTDDHTGDPIPQESPDQGPAIYGRTERQWWEYWRDDFKAEEKRNRDWRRMADQITKRYVDKRKDQGPQYNIGTAEFRANFFYSNTFIQMAFLYGQTPKVDVNRRFADANDDVARVASNILERMLNTSLEPNAGDFSSTVWANLQDNLVPGMGVARVRYEMASHTESVQAEVHAETGEVMAEGYEREVLDWEDCVIQYVHWRDFHWGWCRVWRDVPWVAYDIYMTRDQATERFGPEKAALLNYKNTQVPAEDDNTDNPDLRDPKKTALIREIWDKKTETVQWYHEDYEGLLDIKQDPLGLEGFLPTPKPLIANETTDIFLPTPYFMLAQDLYNEIDQLSTRINIITNAVRVGGVYDASYGKELRACLTSIENELIPVDRMAQLAEKGRLDGIVDFFPTQEIAMVLDKLREMRLETINLLYQITGISDIMRGGGEKYEGVGKARLKAQFGSVRIRALQTQLECWGSALLRLRAEVIAKHFEPETIIEQSNILYTADGRNTMLITEAVKLIKNYRASMWRIQIQPESMAMIDWESMKADRTEFLTALATYLQSSAPMLEQMPQSGPVLMELLKFGMAGFKGGEEIEGVLDRAIEQARQAMAEPQPPEPSPEREKHELKLVEIQSKGQIDMAKEQQKHDNTMQEMAVGAQIDSGKIQQETLSDMAKEVTQADQDIRTAQVKKVLGQ